MTGRGRRVGAAATVAAILIALTACAGFTTAGEVRGGLPIDEDAGPPDVSFIPDAPQPGATPQQIVDGFIRAGSGTANNFSIARLFLTTSFAPEWKPEAKVTIDVLADRRPVVESDTQLDLELTQVAAVDDTGAYGVVDRSTVTAPFSLVQQNGQWRISEAPDGVVLDEDQFDSVYNPYPLMYFDTTAQYLVPDVRWFPTTNTATRIAIALVDGEPSPWLIDSVMSAFTGDVALQGPAVPVEAGRAQVALTPGVLALDSDTRNRMFTQLQASLLDVPGVSEVEMTTSATALDARALPTRQTRVNALALAVTPVGFGFLAGADLEPIDGLTAAMDEVDPAPVAVQLAADRQFAAARIQDGTVVRVQADGSVAVVDTREDLIDPSVDPGGYVWSVPSGDPGALAAFSPAGERVDVTDAWAGASRIIAMEVSRDGARIAAVVTSGGNSAVWVAGIVRDGDGVPQRLGDYIPLAVLTGVGLDISWLGDQSVGALARIGDDVGLLLQPVGGPGTILTAPPRTTGLAGATLPSGVRVRDAEGALFVRRGSAWQQTNSEVLVLATQAGQPQ